MILTEKELIKQEAAPRGDRLPSPASRSASVPRRAIQALIIILTPLIILSQLSQLFPWPHWPHNPRHHPHHPHHGHDRPTPLPVFPNSSTAEGMNWFNCPDSPNTQCAFFTVPWDHLNPSNPLTFSLALRKFPAPVPPHLRLGTLFVNPGGPGASGTEEIARIGPDLSAIVGGAYDLVSWDPRGVNLTSPRLDCFPTEAVAHNWQRDQERVGLRYENAPLGEGVPGREATAEELRWAGRIDAFADSADRACSEHGRREVLEGSGTAATARDLKMLAEAMGEKEGVNYWGFSYGTVLGATFAAMFPDQVRRFVLDGVVNSRDYYDNFWDYGFQAMNQTNRTLDGFFSLCLDAGPDRCALATPNDTLASLHTRLTNLREHLHQHPLPVSHLILGAGIVTTSAVQHVVFRGLYAPSRWTDLALTLAELERGNGTRAWESLNGGWVFHDQEGKNRTFGREMDVIGSGLVCSSIMCSETSHDALADRSLERFVDYSRDMNQRSISGEAWALWIAQCRRWSHTAHEVIKPDWDSLPRTKFPILFVSQWADPVTPLSSAEAMAGMFGAGKEGGASLLVQPDGHGHCSYAQPSGCTHERLRAYFVEGVVPEYGTECEVDEGGVFEPREGGVEVAEEGMGARLAREMGRRFERGVTMI